MVIEARMSMQSPTWIRASELDAWADNPEARALLPELVGRLVCATVPPGDLKLCNFPAWAETHRPEYDGTTATDGKTQYVPAGISYWELSCDKNPETKAEKDYRGRIEKNQEKANDGAGEDLRKVNYVAVTARDWHVGKPRKKSSASATRARRTQPRTLGAAEWARQCESQGAFLSVAAYDSNRLEQWIREAPAVGLWLAREMKKPDKGMSDVQSYWEDIQATLQLPLAPAVLLTNRESICASFEDWLQGDANELAVRAPSPIEVAAVFCAWVHTLPTAKASAVSARAIVVNDHGSWEMLSAPGNPLVLVAGPLLKIDLELLARARRNGHHVLRHAALRGTARGTVELPQMRHFDLEQALRAAGLTEIDANQFALNSGGNFTVLRRRLARSPAVQFPPWYQDSDLASLLLAGAWVDSHPADQSIIERLTGKPYTSTQATAQRWFAESDSPLRFSLKDRGSGRVWEFISPFDAWSFLAVQLTPVQVKTFSEVAVEVLSADHPGLDLPPDERMLASIKGAVPRFSEDLRQGITEILAIGASQADNEGSTFPLKFRRCSEMVVGRVLSESCDWKRWASLGGLLTSLAEAAPEQFLSAVERDLDSASPQLVELLRQENSSGLFGSTAYHCGLLWALETVAWPPVLLTRVALVLARLTELDPGGEISNRPLGSAAGLFFSWRPQTVASLGERLATLRLIAETHPEAAWKIAVALVPSTHGSFMDHAKPSYRNWAAGWDGNVTVREFLDFLDGLAVILLELVPCDPSRWLTIIDEIRDLYGGARDAYVRVRNAFRKFVAGPLSEDLRDSLWRRLRSFVHEHTHFSKADWALPKTEIEQWEAFLRLVEPPELATRLLPLFGNDLPDYDESLTYAQRQEMRARQRREAIREIWNQGGIEAVQRLAARSSQPGSVGWALAEEIGDEPFESLIPSRLAHADGSTSVMAGAYAGQRIDAKGEAWALSIPNPKWTPDEIISWALRIPPNGRVWGWVTDHGPVVEGGYWKGFGAWGASMLNPDDFRRAVESLQRAGRAWDALQMLTSQIDWSGRVEVNAVFRALEAVLEEKAPGRKLDPMDGHHAREAISYLQREGIKIDEDRVARLESAYLPLLGRHQLLPQALQRKLSKNPDFFIECLKLLFRPTRKDGSRVKRPKQAKPSSDQEKARRLQIWNLLRDWETIPGTDDEGKLDPNALQAWIAETRQKATKARLADICDHEIGGIFAHSPPDADGGMPLVPIRDLIEKCASSSLEAGFTSGLRNLRGVYSKSAHEGGKQERELADRFEKYANACARWPRTARALRSVASSYAAEAAREDERAAARD